MRSSQHRRPDDRPRGPRHGDRDLLDAGYGPGFGPGFGGGRGRGRGRRRGGRGGDVRAAALVLLAEGPRHGYQLIQDITERSAGAWKPSPGSIYPVLQQLEDEALLTFERVEGRKTATLTASGQAYVQEHRDELDAAWTAATSGSAAAIPVEAGQAFKATAIAWRQVVQFGTAEQQAEATRLLDETRRRLYGILADDESPA